MSTAGTLPPLTLRMSIAYHCVVLQCFYLRWHGKGEKNTWWGRQFCLISKAKNSSYSLPCVHISISFTCFCVWHSIGRIVHWTARRLGVFNGFTQEWDNREKHSESTFVFSHDLNLQWFLHSEIFHEYFISPTSQLIILRYFLFKV